MVARRVIAAVRAPVTRWFAILVVVLAATLTVSVRVAVRAPDMTVGQRETGSVRYAAIGALSEVGFEVDDATSQGSGRVIALLDLEPRRTTTRTRTTPPRPKDPVIDPDPDPGDDGEEIQDPLLVTALADRTHASQGDAITYSFSVTNVSDGPVSNAVAEIHIPSGTYAAGSCTGLMDEGTLQVPVCADAPGLPASGSDEYHVLRALGTMDPGASVRWGLTVRVGSDTADEAAIGNHCRVRSSTTVSVASSDVWVTVT